MKDYTDTKKYFELLEKKETNHRRIFRETDLEFFFAISISVSGIDCFSSNSQGVQLGRPENDLDRNLTKRSKLLCFSGSTETLISISRDIFF